MDRLKGKVAVIGTIADNDICRFVVHNDDSK